MFCFNFDFDFFHFQVFFSVYSLHGTDRLIIGVFYIYHKTLYLFVQNRIDQKFQIEHIYVAFVQVEFTLDACVHNYFDWH